MNIVDHGPVYQFLLLGGVRSPGRVVLSGHDRVHEWDIRKPMSMGGAATVYRGENIAKFTATFDLIRENLGGENEFELWESFESILVGMLPPGGAPKPLAIYHPDLESRGIRTVALSKLGGMTYDGRGGAKVAVEFLEYRKPKPRVPEPANPKGKLAAPDPNAALKAEVAGLLAQARAL